MEWEDFEGLLSALRKAPEASAADSAERLSELLSASGPLPKSDEGMPALFRIAQLQEELWGVPYANLLKGAVGAGENPNRTWRGETLLTWMAKRDPWKAGAAPTESVFKKAVEAGADPCKPNSAGEFPSELAARLGHGDFMARLASAAEESAISEACPSKPGRRPFSSAA